ncbi:MAG TPA: hypothetical protein VED01_27680 [Burkholderiales bacterium]|nr:hypothetical protein [Burkholderiales bacterium]
MSLNKGQNRSEVDLEQVERLIAALERDLERVSGDSEAVQRLKDEVQTLRNVLGSPVRRHHWVRDALHGIREAFDNAVDTAVADGLKASRYIAEIGRILGM